MRSCHGYGRGVRSSRKPKDVHSRIRRALFRILVGLFIFAGSERVAALSFDVICPAKIRIENSCAFGTSWGCLVATHDTISSEDLQRACLTASSNDPNLTVDPGGSFFNATLFAPLLPGEFAGFDPSLGRLLRPGETPKNPSLGFWGYRMHCGVPRPMNTSFTITVRMGTDVVNCVCQVIFDTRGPFGTLEEQRLSSSSNPASRCSYLSFDAIVPSEVRVSNRLSSMTTDLWGWLAPTNSPLSLSLQYPRHQCLFSTSIDDPQVTVSQIGFFNSALLAPLNRGEVAGFRGDGNSAAYDSLLRLGETLKRPATQFWSFELTSPLGHTGTAILSASVIVGEPSHTQIYGVESASFTCRMVFGDFAQPIQIVAGQRISSSPQNAPCLVPVETKSWGAVKSVFR